MKHLKEKKICVYCHGRMKKYPRTKGTPGDKVEVEHINNQGSMNSESNVVSCCASCNASKNEMKLWDWLQTDYCKEKNINERTITNKKVLEFLKKHHNRSK